MIELRPLKTDDAEAGDLDEVAATNVSLHLETTTDQSLYIIIYDGERYVHLQVYHKGKARQHVKLFEAGPVKDIMPMKEESDGTL